MKLNKKIIACAGLGVLTLIGGTFAYYNETVSLDNLLRSGHYDNELVEDFTPPTDKVKPGATIDKKVGAQNTGTYPVMVRIRMDEKWQRYDGNEVKVLIEHDSKEGLDVFNISNYNEETGTYTATQGHDSDGEYDGDHTVVRKNFSEGTASSDSEATDETRWIFNAGDGYWYYKGILESGAATGNLLESLSIASNIDLGFYVEKDYYCVAEKDLEKESIENWTEYKIVKDGDGKTTGFEIDGTHYGDKNGDHIIDAIDLAMILEVNSKKETLYRKNESLLDPEKPGYSDSNYTLTVTSQFVQATPDALKEAFCKDENGDPAEIPAAIMSIINTLDLNATASTAAD